MVASSNLVRPIIVIKDKMVKKIRITVKEHNLRPEHTKLSIKERDELFKKLNVSLKELPKIRRNDAAIVKMNIKEGDVVKITRISPTAGTSIFYRGVISE